MKGFIFRSDATRDSKENILLQISFYAGILCYAGALTTLFHRRETLLFISIIIPALGFSIIYYFGRYQQKYRLSGIGIITALLITTNLLWHQTFGSLGNMILVFFAIEIMVVVFMDIKKQLATTLLIILYVLILLYL